MNITLTVRGNLEDDVTLQEILAILYHKNAPGSQAEETLVIAQAVTSTQKESDPKPDVEVVAGEQTPGFDEAPTHKPAVDSPEFEGAVAQMVAEAPEPQVAAVDFTTVSAAARKAVNAKVPHEELTRIFEAHGDPFLRNVPEAEYAAVLAEIEAL
ncbi:MAG: hypothetical protein RSN88_11670 [Gordonibacter sp.]|uniref:hypothetical protein n=1 Tax=Gordonibacter sp. TaxID=1968902 RepID=UPI002FC78E42